MCWKRLAIVLLVVALLGVTIAASAQTATVAYNQTVSGYVPAGGAQYWTFYANAGDEIEASVLTNDFGPYLILLNSQGQIVTFSFDRYPLISAVISQKLTYGGMYQLWVQPHDSRGGNFLLSLNSIQSATPAFVYRRYNFDGYPGPDWLNAWQGITPAGRTFLGPFSNQTASLMLTNLPLHDAITVSFDVFVINSWDGNNPTATIGPDIFRVDWTNRNINLLTTTFSNYLWANQSYPETFGEGDNLPQTGAVEIGALGYLSVGNGDLGSSAYPFSYNLTNNDSWLQLNFSAQNLEAGWNESWGLDNVRVFLSQTARYNPLGLCSSTATSALRRGMHLALGISYPLQSQPIGSDTFAELTEGTKVHIIDGPACFDNQNWWLVELESSGSLGWVPEFDVWGRSVIYRRLGTGVDPINWQPLPNTPAVEGRHRTGVNIRDYPSINSGRIIGSADRGTLLAVTGQIANDRWLQVQFINRNNLVQSGWVCRDLMQQNTAVQGVPVMASAVNEDCRGRPTPYLTLPQGNWRLFYDTITRVLDLIIWDNCIIATSFALSKGLT